MIDLQKYEELKALLEKYDNEGGKYAYELFYAPDQQKNWIKGSTERKTGCKEFVKDMQFVLERIRPVLILVKIFSGKGNKSKMTTECEMRVTNHDAPMVVYTNPPKHHSENVPAAEAHQPAKHAFEGLAGLDQFQGLGAIDLYFKNKQHELERQFTDRENKAKIESLETRNKSLSERNEQLESLVSGLEDENEELTETVQSLEKYKPDGLTIAGIPAVPLLTAVGNKILGNVVRNNPAAVAGLFGIEPKQILDLFNSTQTEPEQPIVNREPEMAGADTNTNDPKSKLINEIVTWLKTQPKQVVDEFVKMIIAFSNNETLFNETIEFVNENNK